MDAGQIFFAVNDPATADYVSTRLGEATITVWQESGGESSSTSYDPQGQASTSRSSNTGWNASETARKLLKPEEVMALDERQAIVFAKGTPPFLTRRVRHYEKEFRATLPTGSWQERMRLAAWCFAFALASAAAAGLMLWAASTTL